MISSFEVFFKAEIFSSILFKTTKKDFLKFSWCIWKIDSIRRI
jgi:hypothetical protein